jgi:hypothetical protein
MLVNWSLFELTSKLTQLFSKQVTMYILIIIVAKRGIDHFASPRYSKYQMNMVLYYIHPDEYFRVLTPSGVSTLNIHPDI